MLISVGTYEIRIERRPPSRRDQVRRLEQALARQRRTEALGQRELAWRLRFPDASMRWPR